MSEMQSQHHTTTPQTGRFRRYVRNIAPIGIAGILLGVLLLAGMMQVTRLRTEQAAARKPTVAAYTVRAVSPVAGEVIRTVPALATVKSAAGIRLQAEIAGRLISMKCREGDRVEVGQELATIDARESKSQLQAATAQSRAASDQIQAMEANVAALESKLRSAQSNSDYLASEEKRAESLYQAGALAGSQRDAARNRAVEARSALQSLRAQIDSVKAQRSALAAQERAARETTAVWRVRAGYATLTAPVSGIISARLQEEGQFVALGAPVYVIEDDRQTRLLMQVPQERAGEIRPGLEVLVDLPPAVRPTIPKFRVTRVYPGLNELRQLGVEATSEGTVPGVPFDMQLPARIVTARQAGLILTSDLVFPDMSRPGGFIAYEVKENLAVRRSIKQLLVGDSGALVVAPDALDRNARLLSGAYLDHIRLPATFPVEVAQ